MTREFEFILAHIRGESPDPTGLDRRVLLELADKHAVTPLLGELFPEAFRDTAHFNLRMSAALAKLLDAFARAEMMVVPLKGPLLAQALYDNLALRSFSDVDLLVQQRDVLRAIAVLQAEGYTLSSTLHWACDSTVFRSRDSELSFTDAEGISVDLHWKVLPFYYASPLDDELWKRLQPVTFVGKATWTLSPEDLILFLCAHGAKHLWNRLGWVSDVARLTQQEIHWPTVLDRAKATHTSRMLNLGLQLASKLFGAVIPPTPADDMVEVVRSRYLRNPAGPPTAIESTGFSVRLFETSRQRLLYLFGEFIYPTEAEYRVLQLRPALYWFYYLFRQGRLTAKYMERLFR